MRISKISSFLFRTKLGRAIVIGIVVLVPLSAPEIEIIDAISKVVSERTSVIDDVGGGD